MVSDTGLFHIISTTWGPSEELILPLIQVRILGPRIIPRPSEALSPATLNANASVFIPHQCLCLLSLTSLLRDISLRIIHLFAMVSYAPNFNDPRKSFICVLLASLSLPCIAENADEGQKFRDFLEKPPYIESIVFGEPGQNHPFIVEGQKAKYPAGEVVYEAGMQPNSFFLKNIFNSLTQTNSEIGAGFTIGRNGDTFWTLNAVQSKIMYSQREGSEANSPEAVGKQTERQIKRMLMLGLIHSEHGTVRWDGDFFESASWMDAGKVSGRIVSSSNSLPVRIEYTVEKFRPKVFAATYEYKTGKFPPSTIVRGTIFSGKENWYETNSLRSLTIGQPANFNGYTPSYFLDEKKQTAPQVVFWTNGSQFYQRKDSQLVRLDDAAPPPITAQSQAQRWLRVFVFLIVIAVPYLFYKAAKGAKGIEQSR